MSEQGLNKEYVFQHSEHSLFAMIAEPLTMDYAPLNVNGAQ